MFKRKAAQAIKNKLKNWESGEPKDIQLEKGKMYGDLHVVSFHKSETNNDYLIISTMLLAVVEILLSLE